MSDDKPSDRAIAQAFMHEVWNTQVKDGEASRLIDRVLHYAMEIDAQQPKDESAEPVAYWVIGKYESDLVFGELIFELPTNRIESGNALRKRLGAGRHPLYLHPPAGNEPMSKSRTHRLSVQRGDEPSAEHWKAAITEWHDDRLGAPMWASSLQVIEQRARELAKEGK